MILCVTYALNCMVKNLVKPCINQGIKNCKWFLGRIALLCHSCYVTVTEVWHMSALFCFTLDLVTWYWCRVVHLCKKAVLLYLKKMCLIC
jgi:hypothetical protein